MKTMDVLAGVELPDHEGKTQRLEDLWQDNPVIFVWLRHYG